MLTGWDGLLISKISSLQHFVGSEISHAAPFEVRPNSGLVRELLHLSDGLRTLLQSLELIPEMWSPPTGHRFNQKLQRLSASHGARFGNWKCQFLIEGPGHTNTQQQWLFFSEISFPSAAKLNKQQSFLTPLVLIAPVRPVYWRVNGNSFALRNTLPKV